jgi:hypothetical protein
MVAFHGVPSYRTAGNPAGSLRIFFLLHASSFRSEIAS